MSNCDPSTQNAWLSFTPRSGNQPATMEYCTTANCTSEWEPTPVSWNCESMFNIHRAGGGPPNFTFYAISFWGKDINGNIVTQVVQSFTESAGASEDASYMGGVYVKNISVMDNLIQFTVCNSNNPSGGSVSFQVTILSGGKYFTSMDPECELRPQGG